MSPDEVIARVYRNSDTPAIYRAMIRAATSPGAPVPVDPARHG